MYIQGLYINWEKSRTNISSLIFSVTPSIILQKSFSSCILAQDKWDRCLRKTTLFSEICFMVITHPRHLFCSPTTTRHQERHIRVLRKSWRDNVRNYWKLTTASRLTHMPFWRSPNSKSIGGYSSLNLKPSKTASNMLKTKIMVMDGSTQATLMH